MLAGCGWALYLQSHRCPHRPTAAITSATGAAPSPRSGLCFDRGAAQGGAGGETPHAALAPGTLVAPQGCSDPQHPRGPLPHRRVARSPAPAEGPASHWRGGLLPAHPCQRRQPCRLRTVFISCLAALNHSRHAIRGSASLRNGRPRARDGAGAGRQPRCQGSSAMLYCF